MSTLEKLFQKQLTLQEQISKAAINHKKAGKARRNQGYFLARLAFLKELWDQFSANHMDIWQNKESEESEYNSEDIYGATEEAYFELLADLNEGLKECSSGEAERLLRQFEIIESNYDKAWELLTKRYNNKRSLVNHQIKALLNQAQIKTETSTSFKSFLDQTEECIHELQALELPVNKWDAILIHILVQKLPQETHYHWEQELRNKTELPTYSEFTTFLETRFRMLEALNEGKRALPPKPTYGLLNKSKSSAPIQKSQPPSNTKTSCCHCRGNHIIFHCPTFRNLNTRQRYEFATNKHLCKNCLSPNHTTSHCPSNKKCYHCGKNHNTLLHYEQSSVNTKPTNESTQKLIMEATHDPIQFTSSPKSDEQQIQNFFTSNMKRALLSTALINIIAPSGITIVFRALIDSGSQVSIMTKRAYKRLQLKGSPTNHELIGLGTTPTNTASKQATVTLNSLHSNFKVKVNMLIIEKITDLLPAQKKSKFQSGNIYTTSH